MVSATVWGWISHPVWGAVVPMQVVTHVTVTLHVAAAISAVRTIRLLVKSNLVHLHELPIERDDLAANKRYLIRILQLYFFSTRCLLPLLF